MSVYQSTDPKTWEEAMTSSEAREWKQAAIEEFRSLKKKRAIQILKRKELPKEFKKGYIIKLLKALYGLK